MTAQSFKKAILSDVGHVRVYYDDSMYAAHPNRGGIWNSGNGEIAVAHMLKPVDYGTGEGVHHIYSDNPGAGVMLNRSHDEGQSWPADERSWIWNNETGPWTRSATGSASALSGMNRSASLTASAAW